MDNLQDLRAHWVEHVLGVKIGAAVVSEDVEPDKAIAEREQEHQRISEAENRHDFGEGYKPFDTREVHTNIKQALLSGTMISASDWAGAALPLSEEQRKKLLDDRVAMNHRLAGLGAARSKERQLSGDVETAKQSAAPLNTSIERMAAVKSGPPLFAKGSVGIPSKDYDQQIEAAGDKWYQVLTAGKELEKIVPDPSDKADHTKALTLLGAWKDYWWDMQTALKKAKSDTVAGFDPKVIAKPAELPDLSKFSSSDLDFRKGRITALSGYTEPTVPPPTVPAPNIEAKDYDSEIDAADKKWGAMLNSQWAFEAIKSPTPEQSEALDLIKQWKSYWFTLKSGLTKAKSSVSAEFDPNTITPPAERPDLAALKAAADPKVKDAEKLLKDHQKTAIEPIEQDMKSCLDLLDAPENNPEREEAGGALQMLEDINDKIRKNGGTPSSQMLKEKARALKYLESTLFDWNDRRTRQNLPPAGEAVALADMLQVEHRKMIDQVVANKLPLPIANSDSMDPEEEKALQESWAKLCDGSGSLKIPLKFNGASKKKGDNTTQSEAEQFRSETLANFARLLGSASGRKLVHELENSGKDMVFEASDSAACLATGGGKGKSRPVLSGDKEATTEEDAREHKGSGTGSTVFMVRGAKDSDVALCTQNGAQLHSPRFIAMGHEMVHALHNARGIDRDKVTLTDDPAWNNSEELHTIRKGKLSEQTLRAQYGLSAERFGHKHTDPQQAVGDAFSSALDVLDKDETLKKSGKQPESHGFKHFDSLTQATQIAISEASPDLDGPLPNGWDANLLNVEQMRIILHKRLRANLKTLGWSPFDLAPPGSGDKIDDVISHERCHPRSPQGLRFRSLGAEEALTAVSEFEKETKFTIATWKEEYWPGKLAALEAAESWVAAFGKGKGGEIGKIAAENSKLMKKLPRLATQLKLDSVDLANDQTTVQAKTFAARGGLTAMKRIGQLNMVLGTRLPADQSDLPKMLDALDKTWQWLEAFAGAAEKEATDELTAVITSSIGGGGGGSLAPVLDDVIMCCRRGRDVDGDYLTASVKTADKVL